MFPLFSYRKPLSLMIALPVYVQSKKNHAGEQNEKLHILSFLSTAYSCISAEFAFNKRE